MTTTVATAVPAYRCFEVAVRSVTRLSPHFRRVTFTGHDLDLFGGTCLDQRVKVVLPIPGAADDGMDPYRHFPQTEDWYARWRDLPERHRNPFRTYTARAVRPDRGEVDIDFVCHGDTGVASAWVQRVRAGDYCVLVGPDRRGDSAHVGVEWKPGAATSVLIAGDETALPAISSIAAALPAHVRGQIFVEVPTADDVLPFPAPDGVTVRWLPRSRGAQPAAPHGERLVSAVTADLRVSPGPAVRPADVDLDQVDIDTQILWETPATAPAAGVFAWLAGEASAITTLRRHLVKERGWDRRRVAFMGYWRAGRAEA